MDRPRPGCALSRACPVAADLGQSRLIPPGDPLYRRLRWPVSPFSTTLQVPSPHTICVSEQRSLWGVPTRRGMGLGAIWPRSTRESIPPSSPGADAYRAVIRCAEPWRIHG